MNQFQKTFDAQKALFATGVTRTYEWRVDQLDDALTHAKSMLISPPDVAIEHLYSPYTEEKNKQLAGWFEY